MRSIITSWALTLSLLACGPAAPPPKYAGSGDTPKGTSYSDYLNSDRPKRPADTREADKMTMHVIDIGQGLSVLFEFPCGAILVDTGGEKNDGFDSNQALSQYLEAFFARRTDLNHTLDALVITHPHIDHTRGIDLVVSQYRVRNVITNGQEHDDLGGRPQIDLHGWVARKNKGKPVIGFEQLAESDIPKDGLRNSVIDPIAGCDASAVDPNITALWGRAEHIEDMPEDPNDHSVVLRIEYGKSSVMMTGDLELEGLDHLSRHFRDRPDLLDVDVYLVGHHGSKNATAPHLMAAMSPKIAVISAGPYQRDYAWTARRYGHPNVRAVNELRNPQYGVSWFRDSRRVWLGVSGAWKERESVFQQDTINRAVYNTGWDGTIDVHLYENGWLEVETERKADDERH